MGRILKEDIAAYLVILSEYVLERTQENHKKISIFSLLSRDSNLVAAKYEALTIIRQAAIFRAQLHSSAHFDRIQFTVNISESHKNKKPTTFYTRSLLVKEVARFKWVQHNFNSLNTVITTYTKWFNVENICIFSTKCRPILSFI